jgi:hypothetical protein
VVPRAQLLERVERSILILRGHRVILDAELAQLYGVETRRPNEQVRRNQGRFPKDFAFQLTSQERDSLKSHSATSSGGWGGRRKLPYAFTEHGALMAASVLNSPKAVEMSIVVVRALVELRQFLATNRELAAKLVEPERRIAAHDESIVGLFEAVRRLMTEADDAREPWNTASVSQVARTKNPGASPAEPRAARRRHARFVLDGEGRGR